MATYEIHAIHPKKPPECLVSRLSGIEDAKRFALAESKKRRDIIIITVTGGEVDAGAPPRYACFNGSLLWGRRNEITVQQTYRWWRKQYPEVAALHDRAWDRHIRRALILP